MKVEHTQRGFEIIQSGAFQGKPQRLVQQSSLIADGAEGERGPGSSFLWVGETQLDRNGVIELIEHLNSWLHTGSLSVQK